MAEHVEVSERLSALEANRENDVRRIGKIEDAMLSIQKLGWAILGGVVAQIIITALKRP
jgi:hypothetical protein